MTARIALIGANGHGRSHRRTIATLQAAGVVSLVAMCDLAPIRPEPDAPIPPETRLFDDYRDLLSATRPDAVVICTPPHTHLEIAAAAAQAGADLLLEKPPVVTLAEHAALTRVLAETGRVCQVGFQALGSAALAELSAALATGRYGEVTGVSAVGAWQRPDSYYQRAPWAGRRRVAGRPVLDGALVNPFAHAVMQCLAVVEALTGSPATPAEVELARYCARPIEVDDTAVLRAQLGGLPMVIAVTLCADTQLDGEIIVHTTPGPAVLHYPTDRLQLPGEPATRNLPGRTDLLVNLLGHRARPTEVPLLAGLSRTQPFTALVELISEAPAPRPIHPMRQASYGAGADRVATVPGISAALRQAASALKLPNELGFDWAADPT